jgi:phosphoserine phosphatase RsbX
VPDAPASVPYEWATAERMMEGEYESGDRSLVAPRQDGTLFAVVDGLGHGGEAAVAAREALTTLEAHVEDDLPTLVERCHRALRRTRGAVMAVAVLADSGTLRWTGVGNVDAVVVRKDGSAREHPLLLGGVLGMQVPKVRTSELTLEPGDEVIFATDGISPRFIDDLVVGEPQRTADYVIRRHATGRDDALVLVVRYRGDGG